MAYTTVKTAICDACGAKETVEGFPSLWVQRIHLRLPVKPDSHRPYTLDLCMDCQGAMLKALGFEN